MTACESTALLRSKLCVLQMKSWHSSSSSAAAAEENVQLSKLYVGLSCLRRSLLLSHAHAHAHGIGRLERFLIRGTFDTNSALEVPAQRSQNFSPSQLSWLTTELKLPPRIGISPFKCLVNKVSSFFYPRHCCS